MPQKITVEIDGIGRVELDDSFATLDASAQDAIIQDIVAQQGGSRTAPTPTPPQTPGPSPTNAPSLPGRPYAGTEAPLDPSDLGDTSGYLSQPWFDEQERLYQESINSGAYPSPTEGTAPTANADGGFFRMPNDWGELGQGLAQGTGDIVEGIGDLYGIVGNPLNAALNWAIGDDLFTVDNGQALREGLGFPDSNGLPSDIISGITGGIGFAGLARAGGSAAGTVTQRVLAELGATPVRDGVAGGTAALASGVAEEAGAGPVGQTLAALSGGVAGYKAAGLPQAATRTARAERFATREARQNPYAAFDAEIVEDISRLTTDRAVSPTDPRGRSAVTATQLNSLERSYTSRFRDMITEADLPVPERRRLRSALDRDDDIPLDEINALRGSVIGDAVADGIMRRQRLRQLTPELRSRTGALGLAANVMDFIPGIPGIVSRGARAIARASGDGEAARVNAAERLIARQRGYQRLGQMTGPSGARESAQALWDASDAAAAARLEQDGLNALARETAAFDRQARPILRERAKMRAAEDFGPLNLGGEDAAVLEVEARKALARQAARTATSSERRLEGFDEQLATPQAPTPEARITARDMTSFRRDISDPAPDLRDVRNPVATDAQLARRIQTRDRAIANLEGQTADFDARLADPSTAPVRRAVAEDPVDRMVSAGIQGEFRALDSLSNSTGLSREDATRVLRSLEESNPDLARDIARVTAGHNTSNARMGPVLRPLMRAEAERLGIPMREAGTPAPARSIPPDPEVQARLAALDERTVASLGDDAAQMTQRELSLVEELDQIDVWRGEMDGTPFRDSEAGLLQERPDDLARATEIRTELETIRSERTMRSVDRPQQWEQGRSRYQAQANDAIERLTNDDILDREVLDIVGNAPVQLRDNFRTIEEAEAYIIQRVIPDLEAAGRSPREIATVRAHLFEIAQAKPYANAAAYEAGTSYRPPGRPPAN